MSQTQTLTQIHAQIKMLGRPPDIVICRNGDCDNACLSYGRSLKICDSCVEYIATVYNNGDKNSALKFKETMESNGYGLCEECDDVVEGNCEGWFDSIKHGENSVCESCCDKEERPQCADCSVEAKQYCDECGGYGSDSDKEE